MKLHVNTNFEKFVLKGGTTIPLGDLKFTRSSKFPIDIYFYDVDNNSSAPSIDLGAIAATLGIKLEGVFDSDYLISSNTYEKLTEGNNVYYRFLMHFHSVDLSAAFKVDADAANDVDQINVNIELVWEKDTLRGVTKRQQAIIQNNVNQGTEGTPPPNNPTYATTAQLTAETQNRIAGDAAGINPTNPVSFGNVVELIAQGFSNPAVAMRLSEALILFGERWYHPYKAIFFASDNTAGGGSQSPFPVLNCNSGTGANTQTTGFRLLDLIGDKFKPDSEPIVAEFTILDGTFTTYPDLAVYLLVGSNKFDPRPPSSSEFGVGVKIFNNQVFLVSSDGSTLLMSAGVTRLSTLGQPQEYRIEVDGNAVRLFRRASSYVWDLALTLNHPTVNPAPGGIHYGVSAMIHYEHNGGSNNNRYLRIFDARVATVPKFLPTTP